MMSKKEQTTAELLKGLGFYDYEVRNQVIRTKQSYKKVKIHIAFEDDVEAYRWREQYILNVCNAKEPIRGFFSNGQYVFEFEVEAQKLHNLFS